MAIRNSLGGGSFSFFASRLNGQDGHGHAAIFQDRFSFLEMMRSGGRTAVPFSSGRASMTSVSLLCREAGPSRQNSAFYFALLYF